MFCHAPGVLAVRRMHHAAACARCVATSVSCNCIQARLMPHASHTHAPRTHAPAQPGRVAPAPMQPSSSGHMTAMRPLRATSDDEDAPVVPEMGEARIIVITSGKVSHWLLNECWRQLLLCLPDRVMTMLTRCRAQAQPPGLPAMLTPIRANQQASHTWTSTGIHPCSLHLPLRACRVAWARHPPRPTWACQLRGWATRWRSLTPISASGRRRVGERTAELTGSCSFAALWTSFSCTFWGMGNPAELSKRACTLRQTVRPSSCSSMLPNTAARSIC